MKTISKLFLATLLAIISLDISVNAQSEVETKGYVVIFSSADYEASLKKAKPTAGFIPV